MIKDIEETLHCIRNDKAKGEASWDTVDEAADDYIKHVEYLLSRLREYEEVVEAAKDIKIKRMSYEGMNGIVPIQENVYVKLTNALNKLEEREDKHGTGG